MRQRYSRDGLVDYTRASRTNATWVDHQYRTNVTAGLIASLTPYSAMDPACGDGSILIAADKIHFISKKYFGDISVPNIDSIQREWGNHDIVTNCGSILSSFDEFPECHVVVLTEILEHLPDPDHILREARKKAHFLVASSPLIPEGVIDTNQEHLWGFDEEGYSEMLREAGWDAIVRNILMFRDYPYTFQIWVAT